MELSSNFNTACNCCFGNFSSSSHKHFLPSSGSTYQLESFLHRGYQETCIEPTSCQRSYVGSSYGQIPCYYPRSCFLSSLCHSTYADLWICESAAATCRPMYLEAAIQHIMWLQVSEVWSLYLPFP
ncbi:keratin-associated protein 13-1-like [Peromyscus eremicus]|uniref:keratin-associated protein 13-1-like n=1 Tax=Peromyscus eremicus TaxID=42410 RepID=UPI0027DAF6AB|nr:keratin-associated protein 13-1-like [Peromyscus eremicus]